MRFDILSLFPDYFKGPFDVSILGRAKQRGLIEIGLVNIRDYAEGKHRRVDDRPYGGGPGMLMMAEPVVKAIRATRRANSHVIYLSPQGKPLNAASCQKLSHIPHVILLCGHYEGIDARALHDIDEEICIGDYVLTSGCPAAIVFIDAVARFIPHVLGDQEAVFKDSFQEGLLEGSQYTRPEEFEGLSVPEILKSGNHREIEKWRKIQRFEKTKHARPEMMT